MIKLIAALGNPGPEYSSSRHNAAWQFVDNFPFIEESSWQKKFNGSLTSFNLRNRKIYIVLPDTFMNRSGICVASVANFYKLNPEEILVIHDELELSFGTVGFKYGGGLGGHNGLRSITSSLGTKDFVRFRIGISKPAHKDITSYVLGNFSKAEQEELPFLFRESATIIEQNIDSDLMEIELKYRKIRIIEG